MTDKNPMTENELLKDLVLRSLYVMEVEKRLRELTSQEERMDWISNELDTKELHESSQRMLLGLAIRVFAGLDIVGPVIDPLETARADIQREFEENFEVHDDYFGGND